MSGDTFLLLQQARVHEDLGDSEQVGCCACLLLFGLRSVLILFHQASVIHKRVLQLDSSNIEAIASLGAHQVFWRAVVSLRGCLGVV